MGNANSLREYDTIPKRLKHFVELDPNKELFVFYEADERKSFTTSRVYDLAGRFASLLRDQGFQKKDVIVNTLRNSPERLITDLGAVFAGCIPSNGQQLLTDGADVYNAACTSRAKAIVACPRDGDPRWDYIKPYVDDLGSNLFGSLSCPLAPEMTTAILVERHADGYGSCLLNLLESKELQSYVDDAKPDDVVCIMTSSGSTGQYKLIPHTHAWISDAMVIMQGCHPEMDQLSFGGSYFCDRPIGWLGGYPLGTWGCGHTRVLVDFFDSAHPNTTREHIYSIVSKERCTVALLMSQDIAHYAALSRNDTSGQGFKYKAIFTGGAVVQKKNLDDAEHITDKVITVYGSTEAGFITFGTTTAANKSFYVGKPLPRIQIRVVDGNDQETPVGEVGNIQVKGATLFERYFNLIDADDIKTKKAFTADGWYKMDDVGYYNEDGDLHVTGRATDVIMHGFNAVHPAFVELLLREHPVVEEVFVVPVSDPVYNQNVCAVVRPRPGHKVTGEELTKLIKDKFVAGDEKAKLSEPQFYLILDKLPYTQNGKADRKQITRLAEERYGVKH